MKDLFNLDNPVMIFMSKIADLFIANLLWMICSIPIVTAGAATTALYSVCFKMANKEDIAVCKSFCQALKENAKQATIAWLIFVFGIIFLAFDVYVVLPMALAGLALGTVLLFFFVFSVVVWISVFIYVFALQSYFENTLKNMIKNAIILLFSNYGYSIMILLFDIVITIIGVLYCPVISPVLPILFNAMVMRKIFAKYLPDKEQVLTTPL